MTSDFLISEGHLDIRDMKRALSTSVSDCLLICRSRVLCSHGDIFVDGSEIRRENHLGWC